jgi:hypothetical protein
MFTARPGHHLTPQPLSSGENVFEKLGRGFNLLAFDAPDADVAKMVEAAGSLSIPMNVIRDTFAGGREKYESKLVLVRPDQFVAWIGDAAPTDAKALLARASGQA